VFDDGPGIVECDGGDPAGGEHVAIVGAGQPLFDGRGDLALLSHPLALAWPNVRTPESVGAENNDMWTPT